MDQILDSNRSVLQRGDTVRTTLIYRNEGKSDTVVREHPNSQAYVDIRITHEAAAYEYRIQYAGSELAWDTSATACLSIAYAFDEEGRGGSAGDAGVNWSTPLLREKLLAVFEKEFIHRLDSSLRVTPK
ncbi:MAG: hypothetical protein IPM49_02030 [Flavobacteriales bacterium]|nr:hypothetical protein [Flavobacteriales bacterium]